MESSLIDERGRGRGGTGREGPAGAERDGLLRTGDSLPTVWITLGLRGGGAMDCTEDSSVGVSRASGLSCTTFGPSADVGLSCTTFGPNADVVAPAVLLLEGVGAFWTVVATAGAMAFTAADRDDEACMGSPPPLPASSSSSSSLLSSEEDG